MKENNGSRIGIKTWLAIGAIFASIIGSYFDTQAGVKINKDNIEKMESQTKEIEKQVKQNRDIKFEVEQLVKDSKEAKQERKESTKVTMEILIKITKINAWLEKNGK